MDYEKIYNKFIIDRRSKEKYLSKENYTETHHIIPKCMNGGDEKENIIKLIPEDHFFVHLLLAKIYGGKNWLTLRSMLYRGMKITSINYKDFINKRKGFGLAQRLVAYGLRDLKNHSSDKNIYTLKNVDGKEITGYKIEIRNEIGLTSSQIGSLINGTRASFFGWYYPKNNSNGIIGNKITIFKQRSKEIFKLFHYDGREWEGTKFEFKLQFGKKLNFTTENGQSYGWFKNKIYADSYLEFRMNSIKANKKLCKFKIVKTGKIINWSKNRLCKKFNLAFSDVNDLILGRKKTLKGIKFIDENGAKKIK